MTIAFPLRFGALAALAALSACVTDDAEPSLQVAGMRPLPLTRKTGTEAPARFRIDDFDKVQPDRLVASLGAPELIRWEGQSQLYQYASASCVLDFYLREKKEGDPFRVVHWEARAKPSGAGVDDQDCLNQIAELGARKAAQR